MLKKFLVAGFAVLLAASALSAPVMGENGNVEPDVTTVSNIKNPNGSHPTDGMTDEEAAAFFEAQRAEHRVLVEKQEVDRAARAALPPAETTAVAVEDTFFSQMSDEETDLWFKNRYDNFEPFNTFTAAIDARGNSSPTAYYDLGDKDYTGAGVATSGYLYTNYYFDANNDRELHISGTAYRNAETTSYLFMQVITKSNGNKFETKIAPFRVTGLGAEYTYDFYVGPLKENDFFYIRFDPFGAGVETEVDFTVSHT